MKTFKITILLLSLILLNSCASGYRPIQPEQLPYNSQHQESGITLEYKYDLLRKKYAKKEEKKDVRLVAVKIENNSGRDLIFNKDFTITYDSGKAPVLLDRESLFSKLRQKPATHLFYLLLLPVNFQTTTTNDYGMQETTSSVPVGLILGPGLAAGNLIAASTANSKFKDDLATYDLSGQTIKNGETAYGLLGLRSDNYDALKINILNSGMKPEKDLIVR